MLTAVLAALRVCEPLHLPVSLHLLAEMLDTSTQSALRRLLPLTFDGFLHLHNSAVECTHETFRETAASILEEADFKRFQDLAHDLIRNRHPHLFPSETVVPEKPVAAHSAQELRTTVPEELISPDAIEESLPPQSETIAIVGTGEESTVSALTIVSPITPASVQNLTSEGLSGLDSSIILHGNSAAVQLLRKNVEIAISHDVPCLVESVYGGYREELAALLHTSSHRSQHPFHALSCADFGENELEGYLFGNSAEKGLIAVSEGGTVFLDEISAAPMSVQLRLARLAQALRKHSKQPSLRPAMPDVRIVVGYTIADGIRADAAMRTGAMSNELFFAVGTMRMLLPALSERPEDVPVLARHYAESIATEYGISIDVSLIPSVFWKKLSAKKWIADMTELEANMRSLVLQFDPKRVEVSLFALEEQLFGDIPSSLSTVPQTQGANTVATSKVLPLATDDDSLLSIDDAQKEHILRALELKNGNKTKAAEMLKIKRTTLLARMKKFGLMP
jgi:DNA-binding NtrC family response regulator